MTRRYTPSPRPSFDAPTAITRGSATRYLWGDDASGVVADLIYVSSAAIHALVFKLPAGGEFRHSPEFRTVFGADEVLYVLEGTMLLADPESGEVQRVPRGGAVFFRQDTWHHAFAHGGEPLSVLELFAPPPAAGASGAYARTRPYLEESRYADDTVLGRLPDRARPAGRFTVLDDRDVVWRLDLGVAVGLLASTEHLTVHVLELGPGGASAEHRHGGDEVVYVLEGSLWVRAAHGDGSAVLELGPDDAGYIPAGAVHEYRAYGRAGARALVGVAPSYLP
jgi:quercetin dioxygenase-like cupin family protein